MNEVVCPSYSANGKHLYSSLPNTIRPQNSLLHYTVCTNTSNVKSYGKVKKISADDSPNGNV
jgi:hypothetical protein